MSMFAQADAQQVFESYERRRVSDEAAMAELGPAGFARRDEFLLPVGAEVGWLLHKLILAHRPGVIVEFGTSYGYSTLFLADAADQIGAKVISFEIADYKQNFAARMLADARLNHVVDFKLGDAVENAERIDMNVDFCLIDIWKELYVPCLDTIYPKLNEGAIIVADNMIYPEMARSDVRAYRAQVQAKGDLQTTLLPVGAGIELSCKWPAESSSL